MPGKIASLHAFVIGKFNICSQGKQAIDCFLDPSRSSVILILVRHHGKHEWCASRLRTRVHVHSVFYEYFDFSELTSIDSNEQFI